jgi:hypothetical protein
LVSPTRTAGMIQSLWNLVANSFLGSLGSSQLITLNIQKVKLVQYLRIVESYDSPTEPRSRPYVSNVPKLRG